MITIGKIKYIEEARKVRIESRIKTDGKPDFLLFIEVEKEWARYLVTDRVDAFLVGILNKAMMTGQDICCESPVSAELKLLLERQLICTLAKHDDKLYATKIYAPLTDKPIGNAGAIGTGLSLGVDSFTTIAENHAAESKNAKLTHLVTFTTLIGEYYQKANEKYCADRLYEKEKVVAAQLKLPLIAIGTNLSQFMHPRADYYDTYLLVMGAMALAKLFKAYYISSWALDFSQFNICNTGLNTCESYELLTINCCSIQGGVRFLSGGGEKHRFEKLQTIAKFPLAVKNLHSCLTQHYNCMTCQKCKRNLLFMDALGILDNFSEVYDIQYYRSHRDEYIEWMCQQMQLNNKASRFVEPAYDMIRQREPELIEKYTYPMDKIFSQRNEFKRQRNVYREYAKLYRQLLTKANCQEKLKVWFQQRNIKEVILYGNGSGTVFLAGIANLLDLKIPYVVEDLPVGGGIERKIPRIPENTIDYPPCDAIIICNIDKSWAIEKKLKDFVHVPIYKIADVLELK